MHVRSRVACGDRLSIEQNLHLAWTFACRAEHQIDVLGLELHVDPGWVGTRYSRGWLFGDVPRAGVVEFVESQLSWRLCSVVVDSELWSFAPALGAGGSQIRLRRRYFAGRHHVGRMTLASHRSAGFRKQGPDRRFGLRVIALAGR